MGFSENIKRLRDQYKLTQKEFGLIAGVSDKAISKWETNNGDARMGAIKRICDHFGLKKSELMDEVIHERPANPSDFEGEIIGDPVMDEITDNLKLMTPEEREAVRRLTQSIANRQSKDVG